MLPGPKTACRELLGLDTMLAVRDRDVFAGGRAKARFTETPGSSRLPPLTPSLVF